MEASYAMQNKLKLSHDFAGVAYVRICHVDPSRGYHVGRKCTLTYLNSYGPERNLYTVNFIVGEKNC